ncbi:zinc-binding dehydrogenase [Roseisalinus antarcticus]|uniref:Phthiocerol synthesis polyketide synthase type I PpsC n=1 Tax=Roseisalinus antarcticus TaxID=254357 RepID=A0A1Y5TXS0_9RHOB|nr:zinc-binding dehydrogenase [Roseisalinus antarcticus]SLN75977.1 Phthiocerol synthesis polyketide synthase type I PpsC [Roseisalinus antarcticus]
MKAFRVISHDAPPRLAETQVAVPGRGEVLLRIEACGLNHADLLMARGTYQETPPAPFTLGLEVCGVVLSAGEGVDWPRAGQRVAVFSGQGGLAEQGVFPASRCRAVPEGMPPEVAAGFQIAYGTAHLGLTRRGRLAPGETLLVLGAGGGVGLAAVEVGAALGARVIAVARGADKAAAAQAAGAAETLDSAAPDLKGALKAFGGVDVVFDAVGGDLFRAALSACRPEARILLIGFAGGNLPEIRANHLLVKNVSVEGVYWGG